MFPDSVYDPYHSTWFSEIAGKEVEGRVLHFLLRESSDKR